MTISLLPLPYAKDALAPHISADTLALHHGKHHKGYVDKTNTLAAEAGLDGKSLNEIVLAADKAGNKKLFNQSAQVWNHGFYWHSMTADGGKPEGSLADAIKRDFGGYADFKKEFAKTATDHFASGWGWLVADGRGKLSVVDTGDAETALTGKANPLLVIDVWEHAYYLDHQNKRADYVEAVIGKLLNWEFAAENYARGTAWEYPA